MLYFSALEEDEEVCTKRVIFIPAHGIWKQNFVHFLKLSQALKKVAFKKQYCPNAKENSRVSLMFIMLPELLYK